jgi:hypothetical protein
MRHLFIVCLLLSFPAFAQSTQRGEITLNAHGDVVRFGGAMQLLDAVPLASRAGLHRYIAKRPTEGSFEHKYVCGLILTVEGSRSSIVTAARSLGVNMLQVPMYSVSQECFSFNGAEVDFHVSDFNMNGWDIQDTSGTGRDQTGQFKPEDPDRDLAAYNYIVPLFKKMSADYQRTHPGE